MLHAVHPSSSDNYGRSRGKCVCTKLYTLSTLNNSCSSLDIPYPDPWRTILILIHIFICIPSTNTTGTNLDSGSNFSICGSNFIAAYSNPATTSTWRLFGTVDFRSRPPLGRLGLSSHHSLGLPSFSLQFNQFQCPTGPELSGDRYSLSPGLGPQYDVDFHRLDIFPIHLCDLALHLTRPDLRVGTFDNQIPSRPRYRYRHRPCGRDGYRRDLYRAGAILVHHRPTPEGGAICAC